MELESFNVSPYLQVCTYFYLKLAEVVDVLSEEVFF
jgi:hypothetical protein